MCLFKTDDFYSLNNPSQLILHWQGLPKVTIQQRLTRANCEFVEFAYWLIVPSLGVMCQFEQQICVNIVENLPTKHLVENLITAA